MVKSNKIALNILCSGLTLIGATGSVYAQTAEIISKPLEANACDERQRGDDKNTAENRAVDKAALSAVKLSGVIQQKYPKLQADALDIVAYRIIDEYLFNLKHEVTLADGDRVCVKLSGDLELTPDELHVLVQEYENSNIGQEEVATIAEQASADISFKAQNLEDKKLLFIDKMTFWNGETTDHYKDFLSGLFSHSDYFYITDDRSISDYIVYPKLLKADVYEIDETHHKMEMQVELETSTRLVSDFDAIKETQSHFILFSADRDEQEISDNLLRKMLTSASEKIEVKLDKYLSAKLEEDKVRGE
ncbi:MAG: hypothetical protein J6039_02170 [Alphaproteobacteria bacterium]|nr:hypothetical protein [Alphaproteobacteria bacterium]